MPEVQNVIPTANPAPPANPGESKTFSDADAFGALDALATENNVPEELTPSPEPTPSKPRDETGKFVKPPDKPAPKPEEKNVKQPEKTTPKPSEKADDPKAAQKDDEVVPEKLAPKQLREAYEAQKTKLAAIEKERDEFKSKATKPKEDPERRQLEERLAERERKLAQLEEDLKYSDYSKTDEYKDRYYKPFEDAFLAARSRIASLKIVERKNEEGEVVQASRPATAEDFDALMRITDDDAAAQWASDTFGPAKAATVLYHRERVQELNAAQRRAVEEYRKNGSEREKQRNDQRTAFQKHFNEQVEAANKSASEKYPKWFSPDESDPKGNELLDKGQYLVERVVANGAPIREGDKQMTAEELAWAVSAIRNKAKAFDRIAHREATARKRIAELEKELEQFKKSEPGAGAPARVKPTRGRQAEVPDDVQEAMTLLDAMAIDK